MTITLKNSLSEKLDANFLQFSGGERHVQLGQLPSEPRFVIQAAIQNSNDLMDLLLLKNALDNAYEESVRINLEVPYLPYARQDRVCAPGQAFSLKLMAELLESLNFENLVIWDCHSDKGLELTGAQNVKPLEIIKSSDELTQLLQSDETVLVCPDKGALSRCEDIKQGLHLTGMVRCEKRRDPATGKITHTEVLCDDLTGKCAVITDDICDGGFTFIKIAEQLRAKNVDRVVLFVTHGIFSKGLDVFDGLIDQIYTTNSFSNEVGPNLKRINYTYSFGETL